MSPDVRAAIEQTIQAYFDGLYEGNADKLSVFHPGSALTCDNAGTVMVWPLADWLKAVRERPSPQAKGLARRRHSADRPERPHHRAGEGEVPDPAALLHRLPLAGQGGRAVEGGGQDLPYRNALTFGAPRPQEGRGAIGWHGRCTCAADV